KATSGAGNNYQWYYGGTPIPGATNQVYKATQPGNYKVQVTNADGCSKISQKVMVFSSCKQGSGTLPGGDAIDLFPNPSSGSFTISMKAGTTINSYIHIMITDMMGRVVY